MPMATKLGKMETYNKELPNSHMILSSLSLVISHDKLKKISPLALGLWLPNLATTAIMSMTKRLCNVVS